MLGVVNIVEGICFVLVVFGNMNIEVCVNGGIGVVGVNLWGLGGMLMLFDGYWMVGFDEINFILMIVFKRLEIVKDGVGVCYGVDVLMGVFNIGMVFCFIGVEV